MAEQKLQDIELKEKLNRNGLVQFLHQWLDALEGNEELNLSVKGQQCSIPADAVERAKVELEYEIDEGEYELQLTMKWC